MKKIIILFSILSFSVFAQSPKKFLTQAYIDAFIKNAHLIAEEMNSVEFSFDYSMDNFLSEYENIKANKDYEKVARIFRKYGLGDDGFFVYMVIVKGYFIIFLENSMKTLSEGFGVEEENKNTSSNNELRKSLNEDDMKLIEKNLDKISAAFTNMAQ